MMVFGCSDQSRSPADPHASRLSVGTESRETDCGEETYLLALSPVLAEWETALEEWIGSDVLDTPPTYGEGQSEALYVEQLAPVLAQWETVLDTVGGNTDLVDTPPTYSSGMLTAIYLGELSPVLAQWKTALEGERGEEFLADPPAFPADETAPTIECPIDTTVHCVVDSAKVEYEVVGYDDCDPDPVMICDPPSGSYFQIGDTEVTCKITDFSGNVSQCGFTVTVVEVEPPTITCPGDTLVECSDPEGTVVEFDVVASSDCDPDLIVTCDPPSGSRFEFGMTKVTCTTKDAFGNGATCDFTVTVGDTTPPVIEASASPDELWPPNHKMVDVHLTVIAEDACDASPDCWIYDVTSNEDVNGIGDGNTEPDWEIVDDLTVRLRAERSGPGSGRVYTIHFRCSDDMGNESDGTVDVVVPHDQGH
jgi:hypothetical protein